MICQPKNIQYCSSFSFLLLYQNTSHTTNWNMLKLVCQKFRQDLCISFSCNIIPNWQLYCSLAEGHLHRYGNKYQSLCEYSLTELHYHIFFSFMSGIHGRNLYRQVCNRLFLYFRWSNVGINGVWVFHIGQTGSSGNVMPPNLEVGSRWSILKAYLFWHKKIAQADTFIFGFLCFLVVNISSYWWLLSLIIQRRVSIMITCLLKMWVEPGPKMLSISNIPQTADSAQHCVSIMNQSLPHTHL
jgi:hypothetical protein